MWWGEIPRSQKYSRIYLVLCKKGLLISFYYSIVSPSSNQAWDLGLCCGLRNSELMEISSATLYLSDVFMDLNAQYTCLWFLSSNGLFNPSSFWGLMISQDHQTNSTSLFPTKLVWKTRCPSRYKALCWEIVYKV